MRRSPALRNPVAVAAAVDMAAVAAAAAVDMAAVAAVAAAVAVADMEAVAAVAAAVVDMAAVAAPATDKWHGVTVVYETGFKTPSDVKWPRFTAA